MSILDCKNFANVLSVCICCFIYDYISKDRGCVCWNINLVEHWSSSRLASLPLEAQSPYIELNYCLDVITVKTSHQFATIQGLDAH